jgi:hypothetical protein
VRLGGAPATCLQYTQTVSQGKPVTCRLYEVAANGKMYSILCQTLDPAQDDALTAIATSLKFASPPVVPVPHNKTQVESLGEMIGFIVGVLAVLVIVLKLARRNKA